MTLQDNLLGEAKDYLVENLPVAGALRRRQSGAGGVAGVGQSESNRIAEGVRGDTASNVTKPAKLETGKTINVPLFIKEGETIKIDTRTGAYMGRA